MKKKSVATLLGVFIIISFALFIFVTQILAVPLWWIFSFVKELSGVGQPKLLVQVSPETPFSIGEKITVTVTNSSSKLPVENAEVSIMKDGIHVTVYTDSRGQASSDYFGEVTVIVAQKTGIDSSDPIAIPKMPDIWVRNVLVAIGSAVVGGLVSGFSAYILQQRKERSSKTVSKRTTRKRKMTNTQALALTSKISLFLCCRAQQR